MTGRGFQQLEAGVYSGRGFFYKKKGAQNWNSQILRCDDSTVLAIGGENWRRKIKGNFSRDGSYARRLPWTRKTTFVCCLQIVEIFCADAFCLAPVLSAAD